MLWPLIHFCRMSSHLALLPPFSYRGLQPIPSFLHGKASTTYRGRFTPPGGKSLFISIWCGAVVCTVKMLSSRFIKIYVWMYFFYHDFWYRDYMKDQMTLLRKLNLYQLSTSVSWQVSADIPYILLIWLRPQEFHASWTHLLTRFSSRLVHPPTFLSLFCVK